MRRVWHGCGVECKLLLEGEVMRGNLDNYVSGRGQDFPIPFKKAWDYGSLKQKVKSYVGATLGGHRRHFLTIRVGYYLLLAG